MIDHALNYAGIAFQSISDLAKGRVDKKKFLAELVVILVFIYVSSKLERFFGETIMGPLLKRIFGDGKDLEEEIKRKETEMELLKNRKLTPKTTQD